MNHSDKVAFLQALQGATLPWVLNSKRKQMPFGEKGVINCGENNWTAVYGRLSANST